MSKETPARAAAFAESFFVPTERPDHWVMRPEFGTGNLGWIKLASAFVVSIGDFTPRQELRFRWASRSFVNFSFFDFGEWSERSLDTSLAVHGFDATANLFHAPPGERFETRIAARKRQRFMTVLVRADYLTDLLGVPEQHLPPPIVALAHGEDTRIESFSTPMRPGMLSLATRAIGESPSAELQRIFVKGMASALIALFFDAVRAQTESPSFKRKDLVQLNAVREQLRARLKSPPSIAELAKGAGISVPTLQRGFRKAFGTTVYSYVQEERMEAARTALAAGKSVAEAAKAVGYRSRTTFSKLFKERFGVSPRAYDGAEDGLTPRRRTTQRRV